MGGNAVRGRKDWLGGHKVRSIVAHHEKRATNDESHDPFFVFSSCYLHPTDSLLPAETTPLTSNKRKHSYLNATMVSGVNDGESNDCEWANEGEWSAAKENPTK